MEKTRMVSLTAANTLVFSQSINANSADLLVQALIGKRLQLPPEQTLYVVIESGGGEVNAAWGLKDALSLIPNTQLICRFCASAAGMIFAGSKAKRLVTVQSELLMHEMYIPHITAALVKNKTLMETFFKQSDDFNRVLYTVMRMPREEYEQRILGTDWSVFGAELVKLKLADELVQVQCDGRISMLAPNLCY